MADQRPQEGAVKRKAEGGGGGGSSRGEGRKARRTAHKVAGATAVANATPSPAASSSAAAAAAAAAPAALVSGEAAAAAKKTGNVSKRPPQRAATGPDQIYVSRNSNFASQLARARSSLTEPKYVWQHDTAALLLILLLFSAFGR